ncbi:hypothetical protein HLRTI_000822 [Halorhabdus tiamatea SARL4B]|uniref:SHOCT domain-containing protein n=1 Tax=Halorhabdus tiamatea SARL4B TaxID=1033806 RepID=F7PPE8_9EURY|nr:hypothetical protein [Halorhabdus tiamatea]ERJ07208.1 hypothetical protein HLRTI_000822 [Halorhabdus tiamatea SARL4B]CCQ32827.1 hypothetical protein HTIA_0687 [Halorhabdus tiamatea SARL4B]
MSGLHRVFEGLTAVFAVATLPAGLLAGMFVGGGAAAIVFIVGWFLLVPVAGILAGSLSDPAEEIERATEIRDLAAGIGDGETNSEDGNADDPLDALRRRYAEGEIDEEALERGLEALLETEDAQATDTDSIRNALDRLDEGETATSRRPEGTERQEPALDVE